jgi:hypothetical protein
MMQLTNITLSCIIDEPEVLDELLSQGQVVEDSVGLASLTRGVFVSAGRP